jgi:hypothetical protein
VTKPQVYRNAEPSTPKPPSADEADPPKTEDEDEQE